MSFKSYNPQTTFNLSALQNTMQNISLGGLQTIGSGTNTVKFDDNTIGWGMHPHVKSYEMLECDEDLLVLSCAAYRLHKQGTYYRLLDKDLFSKIIPEDREYADEVREYYSKKDRKSTRLNSSHTDISRMPSSA